MKIHLVIAKSGTLRCKMNSSFNLYPEDMQRDYVTRSRVSLKLKIEQLTFGNGADNLIQIMSRSFLH